MGSAGIHSWWWSLQKLVGWRPAEPGEWWSLYPSFRAYRYIINLLPTAAPPPPPEGDSEPKSVVLIQLLGLLQGVSGNS